MRQTVRIAPVDKSTVTVAQYWLAYSSWVVAGARGLSLYFRHTNEVHFSQSASSIKSIRLEQSPFTHGWYRLVVPRAFDSNKVQSNMAFLSAKQIGLIHAWCFCIRPDSDIKSIFMSGICLQYHKTSLSKSTMVLSHTTCHLCFYYIAWRNTQLYSFLNQLYFEATR